MKSEVNFYSVASSSIEKPLIRLLEKIYESKSKVLLKVKNNEEVDLLDGLLWSYSPITFLPHGNSKSPYLEKQPIFITSNEENPNNADIALIFNEAEDTNMKFPKIIYFFDGHDNRLTQINANRLEKHKQLQHQIKYWQQHESGTWSQVE